MRNIALSVLVVAAALPALATASLVDIPMDVLKSAAEHQQHSDAEAIIARDLGSFLQKVADVPTSLVGGVLHDGGSSGDVAKAATATAGDAVKDALRRDVMAVPAAYSSSGQPRPANHKFNYRGLPAGVVPADVQTCYSGLSVSQMNLTYVDSNSVEIGSVPDACMAVAEQYQGTATNATIPLACGDNCLYYERLSDGEQQRVNVVFP
ncbi:hypothetical protein BX600DRAFT_552965 [Xylariales sp. PMI_506]|nr:hypothetical protein BX600DRAFT_552965 [Xylariales sp. PMI_506]